MSYKLYNAELAYAIPPFSYSFIKERPKDSRYRIQDSKDNAMGSADNEESAIEVINNLNGKR